MYRFPLLERRKEEKESLEAGVHFILARVMNHAPLMCRVSGRGRPAYTYLSHYSLITRSLLCVASCACVTLQPCSRLRLAT